MPIYEFYCQECHTVFNFLSRKIDTATRPACPACGRRLQKEVSLFAAPRGGGGGGEDDMEGGDLPIDETRMERAIEALAGDAERINEDDPRQAADLMRKFSSMTGLEFSGGMSEALDRLEAGEDPEAVEAELGDSLDSEDPFVMPGQRAGAGKGRAGRGLRGAPRRDTRLYDM